MKKVFDGINPRHILNRVINQELSQNLDTIQEKDQLKEPTETLQLIVQYTGKQGHQIISKIKKDLSKALPSKVKTVVTYQGTELFTKFMVSAQT